MLKKISAYYIIIVKVMHANHVILLARLAAMKILQENALDVPL